MRRVQGAVKAAVRKNKFHNCQAVRVNRIRVGVRRKGRRRRKCEDGSTKNQVLTTVEQSVWIESESGRGGVNNSIEDNVLTWSISWRHQKPTAWLKKRGFVYHTSGKRLFVLLEQTKSLKKTGMRTKIPLVNIRSNRISRMSKSSQSWQAWGWRRGKSKPREIHKSAVRGLSRKVLLPPTSALPNYVRTSILPLY